MKRLLIALICATLPAIAQIPSPQINLTGNIGCVGFPCLNSGTLIMSADADRTMTALETSAFYLKVTSSVPLTATRNLIAPLGNFPFTIENATTGGQAIQIIGTTGTGVTIPNGQTVAVWNDGTNFVQIGSAGGGIPGGSNTDVQYNNSGAFGGYPLTNFILSTGNQTITYNTNGASTLTIANPNAGSGASSGYLASNGTDFLALELAGTGTSIPGAASFVISNATAPLDFQTGGGPILFNAPNTNISGALNYAADTGAANAYVVAPPSCVSATHAGTTINFKAANASTGASTLVYCTGSPVTLYKNGSTALTTGDILANAQYSARFDGTNWQLLNSSLTGSSLPSGTGVVKVTSGTGALASPITDYQVPIGVSLANYSASGLPITDGTTTSGSNVVTVADPSSWVTGEGVYIPATADTSGGIPVGGLGCDNVVVSGSTLTMKNSDGSACNATWPSGPYAVPVIHWDVTHGAITSGTNALTVVSNITLVNGNGIRVKGAGAAGADLICPVISVSGTAVTLFQSDGATACNAGTTVTTAQVFHDDTNALKNALNAGTFVRAPGGAYYLSSEVDFTGGRYLYGDGALQTIFVSAEDAINTMVLKTSGVTMKDFGLFQDPGYTPSSGVLFSLCDGSSACITDKLTRLYFYGGWDQFYVQNKAIQDSVSSSTFYVAKHTAVHYSNASPWGDLNFTDNEIDGCSTSAHCTTATGVLIDAADTTNWANLKINAMAVQINITASVAAVARQRFINLSSEGAANASGSYDITIAKGGANAIYDIQFTGGEFETNDSTGVGLMQVGNGVWGVQMTGAQVLCDVAGDSSTSHGLDIAGQNITVTGNTIFYCGDGVRLESTATGTVTGNTIGYNLGWGIDAIGSPAPVKENSNIFSNNAAGNQNVPTYQAVDNFVGTAATALTSHYADTGQSWAAYTEGPDTGTMTLLGNGQVQANTATADVYSSLVPSSANYTVTDTCTKTVSGAICAVMGRVSTSADTLYEAIYIDGTGFQVYKVVAGTATQIGSTYSVSFTTGTPYTIGLVMNGTTISGTVNGTTQVTATDSAITAAGVAGFKMAFSNTTMGNFRVANNSGLVTLPATQEYVQDVLTGPLSLGAVTAPSYATSGGRKGTFVCTNGGTITIANTNELVTSDVIISMNTAGGTITTPPAMKTVTSGTGFTVLCGATDTSTYNYDILN